MTVEVKEERLILKGTRHKAFKTSKEEYIKTERLYGEFYRAIPLPEGAIAEAATAVFVNGVLEIRLPVPPRPEPKTRKVNVEVKPVMETPTTPSIKQTVGGVVSAGPSRVRGPATRPAPTSSVRVRQLRAGSMSRSIRSITVASVFGTTLAFGAAVAWGQEPPSPPVQPSYSRQRALQDLLRRLSWHLGPRRRPVGREHEEAATGSDAVCCEERRRVSLGAGRPDHRRAAAGKGHGGPDMPVWGDAFKASRVGSSEEAIQARIKALVEHLERIQERPAQ